MGVTTVPLTGLLVQDPSSIKLFKMCTLVFNGMNAIMVNHAEDISLAQDHQAKKLWRQHGQ